MNKSSRKNIKRLFKFRIAKYLIFVILSVTGALLYFKPDLPEGKIGNFISQELPILPQKTLPATTTYKLLVVGDIFLDRHIDELTQKDNKTNPNKYTYIR
jgi:hypothetical protein